ncbi:hypothetical protein [Tenacibaculum sp. SDUM215027]|uniref:hypothetical protein n=1 Tax=Tenacibaculum sp. SDUM215027 TaxID=3422596 RepID=UPI003D31026A
MKFWITNEKETSNIYLIANEKSLWITEQPIENDISKLITEQKLTNLTIIRFEEIKEILLNDTDQMMTINFKNSKEDDIEIVVTSGTYSEIKTYLLTNLKGIVVKNYSLFKQIKPYIFGLLLFGVGTWILYNTALSLQNGDTLNTSGRRGLIKKIFVGIADFLGPTGVLVIGGIFIVIFIIGLVSTIKKPKEGKIIKIKNTPELIFS